MKTIQLYKGLSVTKNDDGNHFLTFEAKRKVCTIHLDIFIRKNFIERKAILAWLNMVFKEQVVYQCPCCDLKFETEELIYTHYCDDDIPF